MQHDKILPENISWKDFASIKKWKKGLKQSSGFGELPKEIAVAINVWFL